MQDDDSPAWIGHLQSLWFAFGKMADALSAQAEQNKTLAAVVATLSQRLERLEKLEERRPTGPLDK